MFRKPMVVANWKMNKVSGEALEFAQQFKKRLPHGMLGKVEVIICPAFLHLNALADGALPSGISLGAQDVHWKDKGAFTGCVSATMLKDLKVHYAIVGHSERRQYFGESIEMLRDKLKACVEYGLKPIFCVGERLEDRERGKTMDVLKAQMASLSGLTLPPNFDPADFILAYEPVWAIGTGHNATTLQVEEVHRALRQMLAKLWGQPAAQATRILYGGSVTPDNFDGLAGSPEIDGGLVGGASLDAEKFVSLIEIAAS